MARMGRLRGLQRRSGRRVSLFFEPIIEVDFFVVRCGLACTATGARNPTRNPTRTHTRTHTCAHAHAHARASTLPPAVRLAMGRRGDHMG